MDDLKPWERQPNETARAYECFKAYRDAGPSREVKAVYRRVVGKPEARAVPGAWNGWIARYKWQERVRAYDDEMERHAHQVAIEAKREEHRQKLEQFRKAHEQFGIGGFDVSLKALRLLSDFLKAQPEITSMADATRVGQLVQTAAAASQAWADALGVTTLLESIDGTQD